MLVVVLQFGHVLRSEAAFLRFEDTPTLRDHEEGVCPIAWLNMALHGARDTGHNFELTVTRGGD